MFIICFLNQVNRRGSCWEYYFTLLLADNEEEEEEEEEEDFILAM